MAIYIVSYKYTTLIVEQNFDVFSFIHEGADSHLHVLPIHLPNFKLTYITQTTKKLVKKHKR